jgi:hypothetical protein
VFFSEGEDFVLSSEGSRHIYRASGTGEAGFGLAPGDIIQTGPGSMVEIQLLPEAALIKTAENTSFVFNGPGNGLLTLTLLYGRLRVVTGDAMGAARLRVITGRAETEIRAGDMGIDYLIPAGNAFPGEPGNARPKLFVSALSGSAAVRLAGSPGGGYLSNAPSIPVGSRETVSLEFMDTLFMIERKPLDPAIPEYWQRNRFKGTGPLPLPDTGIFLAGPVPPEAAPASPAAALPGDPAFTRRLTIKNVSLLAGILLCGAGAAFEFSALPSLDEGDMESARSRMIAGALPLGLGLSGLVFSLLINPAPR